MFSLNDSMRYLLYNCPTAMRKSFMKSVTWEPSKNFENSTDFLAWKLLYIIVFCIFTMWNKEIQMLMEEQKSLIGRDWDTSPW